MSDVQPAIPQRKHDPRRLLLIILALIVVLGAIGYAVYYLRYASRFESTDDAYVGGDVVSITSREPSTVLALHADNTQVVRRGQLLVELDPVNAGVALEAAEADLARAVRAVRANFSKVDQGRAQSAAARVALNTAENDFNRRSGAGNSVSAEDLNHARDAMSAAQAQVDVAQSDVAQAEAAVNNTRVASNPDVLAAIARVRQAAIVLQYMKLYSPVDGVVAQRTAQLGQQVAPGTPLMAVVPIQDVWIDANFKEHQLADMRVHQPVTISADIYGGGVTYHGRIQGLGAGSGSAFALLPPQNASGNWIKIVQRVPVRIALDQKELREHPLRIGLSVTVSVDISDTSGSSAGATTAARSLQGDGINAGGPEVETLIARILRLNGA